jgi:hypothetical protein
MGAEAGEVPLKDLDLATIRSTYEDTLKTYFAQRSPSMYTVRNTFQNLRQLDRLLDESGILPRDRRRTPTTRTGMRAARQELQKTSPYKSHYSGNAYGVPKDQWPPEIAQKWQRYCTSRVECPRIMSTDVGGFICTTHFVVGVSGGRRRRAVGVGRLERQARVSLLREGRAGSQQTRTSGPPQRWPAGDKRLGVDAARTPGARERPGR